MTWLALPILALFAAYYLTTVRRLGAFTASSVFAYFQLVLVLGTLPLLNPQLQSDREYAYILTYAICAYMITSMVVGVAEAGRGPAPERQPTIVAYKPTRGTWAFVAVSVVVVVIYYYAVGYSALFEGIKQIAAGGSQQSVATLRLNSYSGSRYLAPGYVNQFKNTLLPALAVVMITYYGQSRSKRRVLSIGLTAIVLFGILGTGQRGAFVVFLIIFTIYLYLLNRARFRRRIVIAGLCGVLITGLSTFALGRQSAQLTAATSSFGRVGAILDGLWQRITVSNQSSGVAAFHYTWGLPNQHGAQWWSTLVSLLPGTHQVGTNLDNLVFASLYGGTRGTSPPSIWGSIYYNFGLSGVILLPILFAIALQVLSVRSFRRPSYNTLELMGIAGVWGTFATWIADGPNYLANAGLGVYVILWIVGRRVSDRAQVAENLTPLAVHARSERFVAGTTLPTHAALRVGVSGSPGLARISKSRRAPL